MVPTPRHSLQLFLLILTCATSHTLSAKVKPAALNDAKVPKFYLESEVAECRVDSPELFYYGVALPSLTSVLEEGKIFFGVLMDRLESSLAGAEKYESLEKEWTFLTNVISESFELAVGRIHMGWYTIIDNNDAWKLPWEIRLSKAVLLELFISLTYEYQVLEAVVKAGTKEIVGTLQKYLIEVMEKLEDKIFAEPSLNGEQLGEAQILDRMESAVSQLEPNFVGNLLKKLLIMARNPSEVLAEGASANFLGSVMEEIAIAMEAYRTQSQVYPYFWFEMTEILKSVNGSVNPSTQDLLELYLTEEDLIIDSVISLLTMNLHESL